MSEVTEETARRIARLGRVVAAISTVVVVVKSEQHGDYPYPNNWNLCTVCAGIPDTRAFLKIDKDIHMHWLVPRREAYYDHMR